MTIAQARPTPPRRAVGLLLPLLIMVVGMTASAFTALPSRGLIWGPLCALAVVVGLRAAKIEVSFLEAVALVVACTVSTYFTVVLIEEAATLLSPWVAFRLSIAWLISGIAVGIVVARRKDASTAANVALLWTLAGVVMTPMAASLDVLEADNLGAAPFVLAALLASLIGGGATLSAITGVRSIAIGAGTLVLSWFAASQVGFTITGLVENISNIAKVPNFWPPAFGWVIGEGTWWWLPSWDFGSPTLPSPLIETFRIAILASIFGCLVALPVAFMASTITAPSRLIYLLDKSFMNIIRTVPDLFWAMLFVAGVGIGPFAGVLALFFFSLAIMSKLLSETVDTVDTGPLEAAKATGGSHFPAVRMSVLPQVLPNYVAYALYVFEINIRASVVLGLVGAGGIGRVLEAQRVFFRFDRVLAVVIIIFVIVFIVEQVSVGLRRRLV